MTEEIKWIQLSSSCCGKKNGHIPGHQYCDVLVKVEQLGQKFRVKMIQTWGSAQDYDQENSRHEVSSLGNTLDKVIAAAKAKGRSVGMSEEYIIQALSAAHSDAYDTLIKVKKQKENE